ncbi:MAG: hypothetical protein H7X77_04990, partial [Anaerolineae bacterium]|nr:hypothetical protein [Anaerolineae bacterium]
GNHTPPYVPPPEVQYEGRTSPADWSPLPQDATAFPPFDDDDEPQVPRRCIVISLKRTDDSERDQRVLKRLYGTLSKYPGPDRFIILVEFNGKEYEMSFKNTSTNSRADELWAELKQMNGNLQWEVYDET